MQLSEIEADLYRRLGFDSAPITATITRLRAFINETQQELLAEPGMEVVLRDTTTVASVASQPEYSLPQTVSRINHLRDTTNLRTLSEQTESWYRTIYPSPTTITGLPVSFVDLGERAVIGQPVAGTTQVSTKSDSASDDGTKTLYLDVILTDGTEQSRTIVLNGLTAVNLNIGANIASVTKVLVALTAGGSTTAVGTIILYAGTGATGVELSRIPIGKAFARYRHIALAPCPSSVLTYTIDYEREVLDMAQATDQPIVPLRFHRLLAIGARKKEYEKTDNTRYLIAAKEFDKGMKKLKFWLHSEAAGRPNLRGLGVERPSRLGAWFPSV